jgi:hypothetical protein
METEPDKFPTFEQSGFYKQWLASELAGLHPTRETSLKCLELAAYIYQETRKDWEAGREATVLPRRS